MLLFKKGLKPWQGIEKGTYCDLLSITHVPDMLPFVNLSTVL